MSSGHWTGFRGILELEGRGREKVFMPRVSDIPVGFGSLALAPFIYHSHPQNFITKHKR